MLAVEARYPACRGDLRDDGCAGCGRVFPANDGTPVLVAGADLAAIDLRETGGVLPAFDSSRHRRPAGYEAWRQIAPSVEVLAVRRPA
jgi:ABC-type hemin transport system substrate-binding protein